jgi:hypothetical protein
VQATTQARGVAINSDDALEREADAMGARAAQDDGGRSATPVGAPGLPSGDAHQSKCEECGAPAGDAGCTACGAGKPAAGGKTGGAVQRKTDSAIEGAGVVQLQVAPPGIGMTPPGDCSWAHYIPLLGAVESAKAIVSMLGACAAGDNCPTLALKIAAIAAEVAARVARDATCFRGGDAGHRQQVQDKINMMNRCYRFFTQSNCSQRLVQAMMVVVEQARQVVAAAAVAVVAAALIVALVAAIIALVEAIVAAGAAAGAAAVMAVLVLLLRLVQPVPDRAVSPA